MSTPLVESSPPGTHEVLNQSVPRVNLDELAANRPLVEAVERHDAGWARERLHAAGRLVGSEAFQAWADLAHRNTPVLESHDRYGHRIDEVRYDPAWHEVMRSAIGLGAHALPWREPRPGAHVARAALFLLLAQGEPGHACPVSMTYSAVPALRAQPELAAEWEPRLASLEYDFGLRPAAEKAGALAGMAMTEKQGGSDVRANTTRAVPLDGGGPGGEYALTGHKWFCSAPMCDVFLVLAQAPEGLSCFLVPRVLPDGARNPFRLQRLKDKLGNRSNASSELELEGTRARMVGEPGRGVRTIIEMVNHTRLDCVLGTTAGMRRAVAEATWHAARREAFGRRLVEQPLMSAVLADLCLEAEAATATALRLARTYDDDASEQEVLFKRLGTAVAKYWVCKRGPQHAFEALECLGGNGYVETFPLARCYREQPLTSIWEGSGNVMCLDVLRAMARTPASLDAFLAEVDLAAGADPHLDAHVRVLRTELADFDAVERRARRLVERMGLALQASLLVRHAPPAVADAFCASRLSGEGGHEYGTLPRWVDTGAIVERHADAL
jgi:putative acyl-CoA dehydrogenase